MGSATFRCFTLFPLLLLPRPSSLRFLSFFSTRHHHRFLSPSLTLSSPQHSHSLKLQPSTHWPEFSDFINWAGHFNGPGPSPSPNDDFVDDLNLPLDFFQTANICLSFSQNHPDLLWSLPREDIEVVVNNSSPFLFKDASTAITRMKSFLDRPVNYEFISGKPSTVDLMKFLLSFAAMRIVSPEKVPVNNRVESSVRILLSEFTKSSGTRVKSATPSEDQVPERQGWSSRSPGKNIEMKRGDWICPRCQFMNFAKNSNCLECEEPRPKKCLTGKEWECPQCNFFNFGKNAVCLRCDCKNPSGSPPQNPNFISNLEANTSSSGMEEKQQSWFTKIKQLELSSETGSDTTDVDFHVTKLIGDLGTQRKSDADSLQTNNIPNDINVKISQCLDQALGQKSSSHNSNEGTASSSSPSSQYDFNTNSEDYQETMPVRKGENRFVVSKKKDRSLTSPMYKRREAVEQVSNNNFVPFVPFPPGYFATDKPNDASASNNNVLANNSDTIEKNDVLTNPVQKPNNNVDQTIKSSDSQFRSSSLDGFSQTMSKTGSISDGASSQSSENQNIRDTWRGRSLEGSAVKEPDPLDMSEEAKAERWFRRVAQIKDISELSQIPDEDFPSIMPMRKGVNRFVVSKRKTPLERRLTSSKYQRNLPIVSSDPAKEENDSS